MNNFFRILLISYFVFFGFVCNSEAMDFSGYASADDFSNEQLKIIARKITASGKGTRRITHHILPEHKDLDESNAAAIQGKILSYFRLNNHTVTVYQDILNFVINNGTIVKGKESSAKRFSILCEIPTNQFVLFGSKENDSIGAWMQGDNYKKVRKVKAVFSVINMQISMSKISLDYLANLIDSMNSDIEKSAGDLITAFPIPNHWNQ